MAEHRRLRAATGRAHADYFAEFLAAHGRGAGGVAAVLGADVDASRSPTRRPTGMNAAIAALDWRPGDRAVTTRHEHPGGLGPLYRAARPARRRARRSSTPATAATTSGRSPPSTPRSRPAPGSSRSRTSCGRPGAVLPVARIAELAHARGALVVVDGAQAAGAIPVVCRRPRRGLLRHPGPEVAARARGDGRPRRSRRGVVERAHAGARRLRISFERVRPAGDGRLVAGRPPVRGDAATTARRSSGWPARSAGCRCTSGSTSSTRARPGAGRRGGRRAWPRSRASSVADAARRDGHAGHVPDRRLAGRRPPSTSSARGSSRSPGRSPTSTRSGSASASSTTEDELERFAEAVELLAGHTPETLPPRRDAGDPGRGMTEPTGDPSTLPAASRRGRRSAGASSGTRPGPVVRAVAGQPERGDRPRRPRTSPTTSRSSRGAVLPGGDLRMLAITRLRRCSSSSSAPCHLSLVPQPTRLRDVGPADAAGARRSASSPPSRSPTSSWSSRSRSSGRCSADRARTVRSVPTSGGYAASLVCPSVPIHAVTLRRHILSPVVRVSGPRIILTRGIRACPSTNSTSRCPSCTARRPMRRPPRPGRDGRAPVRSGRPADRGVPDRGGARVRETLPARAYAPGGDPTQSAPRPHPTADADARRTSGAARRSASAAIARPPARRSHFDGRLTARSVRVAV